MNAIRVSNSLNKCLDASFHLLSFTVTSLLFFVRKPKFTLEIGIKQAFMKRQFTLRTHSQYIKYEDCSNMNASSFITFFTYMLRQNVIRFWKELFVAFKMAPNIKTNSLHFSSYKPLDKGYSCILKFF